MTQEGTRAVNGTDAQMLVSVDQGTNWFRVEELISGSLQDNEGTVAADSHKFRTRSQTLPGRGTTSLTFSSNWLRKNDDEGTAKLREARRNRYKDVRLKVLAANEVGAEKLSVGGHVGSMNFNFNDAAAQTIDFTFQVNTLDDEALVTEEDLQQLGPLPD